jgi:isopentenyl diphosphate isomerase/L-lactate dehydrogenase-like FMN-dependent dehydrogenase
MMKFPPAELENCMTFPVVLEPMTVRTLAEAAGVALNVAAAVDVMAPMVVTLSVATFIDWETMTFPE